jgi:hypothetical protein
MLRRVRSSHCGHAARNVRVNSGSRFMLATQTALTLQVMPLCIYNALE